jgi:hypothetical protein
MFKRRGDGSGRLLGVPLEPPGAALATRRNRFVQRDPIASNTGRRMVIDMTPRQRRFVDEYLLDLNATQAAIRAGYSPRTANEQGARLLANASIAAAIQAAQQARSKRVQITTDDVLRGLHREATLAGDGVSHAARISAWGLIGKHLGMFVDRRQQLGEGGQPVSAQVYTISITG